MRDTRKPGKRGPVLSALPVDIPSDVIDGVGAVEGHSSGGNLVNWCCALAKSGKDCDILPLDDNVNVPLLRCLEL